MSLRPYLSLSSRSGVATKSLPVYRGLEKSRRVAVPLHGDLFMPRPQNTNMPQPIFSLEDSDLSQFYWTRNKEGYSVRTIKGEGRKRTTVISHRVVLSRILARELKRSELCDHDDGNAGNNRRNNLRLATHQQNSEHKPNASKYRGATLERSTNKWRAQVIHHYKKYSLGCYNTREEAARVALAKRTELGFMNFTP